MQPRRDEQGFTLVELMIVVAIIGVLAAIAIPNFLTYQMRAKTAEARTSLAAIKTASLSFQAERSCFLSVQSQGWPGTIPVNGAPLPWPVSAAAPSTTALCINPQTGAPGPAVGTFGDIGFVPSSGVRTTTTSRPRPIPQLLRVQSRTVARIGPRRSRPGRRWDRRAAFWPKQSVILTAIRRWGALWSRT